MSDPIPSTPLKRSLILTLLAVFACGILAGGAGMWFAMQSGSTVPSAKPHPPPPEDMPVWMADKMCDALKVESELREQIRQVFRDGFVESEPMRKRMGEEMKEHIARQNDKIRALLNPETAARFDALLAEWEKKFSAGPPPK